jgi:hypothetical protein
MIKQTILVKIGGKIIENKNNLSSTIDQLKTLVFKKKILNKVIIITGGGSCANFIRFIDNKLDIGNDLAHWEAILSMDWNSLQLHSQFPKITLFSRFSEVFDFLKNNKKKRRIILFQSFSFLYTEDILPHNWNVTSDSIAIYIASKLGLNKCFLIKNIDGILDKNHKLLRKLTVQKYKELKNANKLANFPFQFKDLKKQTPIDSYSLQLIDKEKISCILLNGINQEQCILKYFDPRAEKKKYTRITSEH